MKKIIILMISLMLSACSSSSSTKGGTVTTTSSFTGDYYKMINTGRGVNSENLYLEFSSSKDLITIGSGLQILSTSHFSTDSHYLSEGSKFTNTDYKNLLRRDSANAKEKKYPYSLQVSHGTTIDNVKDPIMVDTFTELDYYTKSGINYNFVGSAFSIVLDPRNEDNSALSTKMSQSEINKYANTVIKKFYNYIVKKKSDYKNKPVLIAVYQANDSSESENNGHYIYESYCENNKVGTIKKVNHENVTFSSTRASQLDPTTASNFNEIKTSLKNSSTEAAGIVGEGRYINDTIQSMKIEARFNIKTYTEFLYLTSVLADNIDTKFKEDFQIHALVYSQDKLMATITKNKGQDAQTNVIEQ